MLNHKPVVLDFEGFKSTTSGFIVKELAVCADNIDNICFKPPKPFEKLTSSEQKSYLWCERNLHGIHWWVGNYDYSDLPQFGLSIRLRHPRAKFYAKGSEKCAFFKSLIGVDIINLDSLGCPKVEHLPNNTNPQVCSIHCRCCTPKESLQKHCALRKVIAYMNWLEENSNNCTTSIEAQSGSSTTDQLLEEFDELCNLNGW